MNLIIIGLVACFTLVFFQDWKERSVYWFLFPAIAILGGILMFLHTDMYVFMATVIVNISFVITLLGIVYLYARFKLKLKFNEAIAMGDILMFLALAISFSSIVFIVLFIFSLIFSLILHLIFTQKSKYKTVPLAGNMSLFFGLIYLLHSIGIIDSLYI